MNAVCIAVALTLIVLTNPLRAQETVPLSRFAERKAEVLLRERLPCLGCHQFGNEGGRLAPDLATVRSRRSAEYIAAIVRDPQRVRPGTPMPRHRQPVAQEALIVHYLSTRPGNATEDPPPLTAGTEDRSAGALYARFCGGCHGTAGRGDGPNAQHLPIAPAMHSSSQAMSARSDDALFDTIAGGGEIMNRSPRMPAFGETLTPAEVTSLVKYIRTLCKCAGPAWSASSQ